MCGIFGLIDSDRPESVIRAALAGTEALAHRGPDNWGLAAFTPGRHDAGPSDPRVHVEGWSGDATVALGHRRLSIIDLSEAGRQPMHLPASGNWISFNGEIYNFQSVRADLATAGVTLDTATDTEVILQALRTWGPGAITKLRGMFAFALWDPAQGELRLVRDRIGKKPLFYHRNGARFAFASELKAFQALPGWRADFNIPAVHDYLTYGYVPGTQTIFRNVWKVPPGSTVIWRRGEVRVEQYWDVGEAFGAHDPPGDPPSEDEALSDVRALLTESVRLRLVGDVPLGAFLSGGLDSSLVVGLMARELGDGVKTFSIGFKEDSFNELDHARTVANVFRTDHHEFVVEARAAEHLPELVWRMDEPFADASALPTFLLARLARQHVTVVLTGDGGDESFAGYDSYRAERWLRKYERVPRTLRSVFEAALAHGREGSGRTAMIRRAKRFVEKGRMPFGRREWRLMFADDLKRRIYRPEFSAAIGDRDTLSAREEAFAAWRGLDPITQLQLWDFTVYLPDDLMVKTDRSAMAFALEPRCPLLDHVLIERCARLPANLKVRGGTTKYLLKRAAEDLLPASIVHRPKQGFGVPVSHWLRGELRGFSRDVLLSADSRTRGWFEPKAVAALLGAHESRRVDHGHRLWALLTLELWLRHQ